MNSNFITSILLLEKEQQNKEILKRRIVRDHSNPLDLPESLFINSFRLNKEAFLMVLEEIKPFVEKSSISAVLHLATALRFLAEGGYQKSVGKDRGIALASFTVSKVLTKMLNVLESKLCPNWINLSMSEEGKRKSKRFFLEKYDIPGVTGCVDGTHIKIIKPFLDDSLFFNRKGYFSINVMIICDFNMNIRAVDAHRPGSSHDLLIWSMSCSRNYFLTEYERGERGSWLLGDSGYPLEPFLLTPYRDANLRTLQHRFNQKHSATRNIVERSIGVLKARFRCLLGTLPYKAISHKKL